MDNRDVRAAKDYHESTKLTYINLRNKPPLYRSYEGFPEIPLPTGFAPPDVSTLEAVAGGVEIPPNHPLQQGDGGISTVRKSLDLAEVARMLYYSAGLLHKRLLPVAGEVHYRAAASAGALYPVEVYLVAGDIPGLAPGVYHFSPAGFNLRQLRKGDYRGVLALATAGDRDVASAPMTLVLTAVFWRSAWKYRVRSYRYCLWDAGTILANLLATVRGEDGLPARLVTGFVDLQVNNLLGLHPEREASLCLVPIGAAGASPVASTSQTVGPLAPQSNDDLANDDLANDDFEGEISYPEIVLTHAASSLKNEDEVRAWRQPAAPDAQTATLGPAVSQELGLSYPQAMDEPRAAPLGATIAQRGSTRRFARAPIAYAQFGAILETSTKRVPADFAAADIGSLLEVYIIVNAVEDLRSGAYYFSPIQRRLELLKAGSFREEAGHLCFEQALGADAGAVMYFLADLDRVLERYGNRGYRAAQLEAGVMVGNAYLCAHSLGLGATGMTFYDDDVTEFFSPHSEGKSMMFLVALGEIDKRNRVRPFRSRIGVLLDSLARGAGRTPFSKH